MSLPIGEVRVEAVPCAKVYYRGGQFTVKKLRYANYRGPLPVLRVY